MTDLSGARVALLEARMTGELAGLVQRHGGQPYSVPAVREAALASDAQGQAFIRALAAGQLATIVLLTGVGVRALFAQAEQQGCLPALLQALRGMALVCRGPKPVAALKEHGLTATLTARSPYTTAELLEALGALELAGTRVALLHYGERSAALAEALRARGALLEELCVYEWRLPEDLGPLRELVGQIIAGQVDAVAFTSQVQARHLYQVADELGLREQLTQALNQRTIVASVGPTCTAALVELGVTPQVEPHSPKMGAMVVALGQRYAQLRGAG